MKTLLLFCLLVTSVPQLAAQDWQPFSDKASGITFSLPENTQTFEQEQLRVYKSAINPEDEIIRQVPGRR